MSPASFQYVCFVHPTLGLPRVGHYDLETGSITLLTFASGSPITDLYQVIEAGSPDVIKEGNESFSDSQVKLLPPLKGRDVLAVGKNYAEHAKEFNDSGFDSSDKVALPSHPVIFTKRATSIIAHHDSVFPHPLFSSTVDYEGELGVIIGKAGFRIDEANAMDHVWGYTIINDITARERQRDHKQFFIGKSADTFCPMGPIAVAKENVPAVLQVQTSVNGAVRQSATTDELIFSIPTLVKVLSEGQTLLPGDVIATGTPAGVGIGMVPPVYLQPGDEVSVTITGLGTLTNQISSQSYSGQTDGASASSSIHFTNAARTLHAGVGLQQIGTKRLNYKRIGTGNVHVVFIHGLGASMECWTALTSSWTLHDSHSLHFFDLEGHGLSLAHPLSRMTIDSFEKDVEQIFRHAGISSSSPATIVAHSFGCLPAVRFALNNPDLVHDLVLLGPPPCPLMDMTRDSLLSKALLARNNGMSAVVDDLVAEGISHHSRTSNPLAVTALRLSILAQDPETFANAAESFVADTGGISLESLQMPLLIVTGSEDVVSRPSIYQDYASRSKNCELVVLENVGHWPVFEDPRGVDEALSRVIHRS
ncbi:hypothetical protein B0I35DRAFT_47994 [Stachybotrys elegans]|uniref:AB hydrolase-1 domain-containing protein n=1 Tax=Stachybotrys elegans TaxID=80388 RepID=A0A8K0T0R7_9HYPO|nr:hypothetical protein B0I35DRAFT_47994 [Stachybotrys elegans]